MIITIDGPTASGKSTIARLLAKKWSFYYINSGFLYRALAYLLYTDYAYQLADLHNADLALCRDLLLGNGFSYIYENGQVHVFFKGNNITPFLKSPLMDQAASLLSINAMVRALINEYQRLLAQRNSVIADGRDCGSIVFPQADYKFFLTALLEVRAQRWCKEQALHGNIISPEACKKAVQERDARDMQRPYAPLEIAPDVISVDNSEWTVEQTVKFFENYINTHERKK
ncbi:MAG: (d)CMP kinase [Candidatus Babeliaceae bacterium]